jgi:hypothetical protein
MFLECILCSARQPIGDNKRYRLYVKVVSSGPLALIAVQGLISKPSRKTWLFFGFFT